MSVPRSTEAVSTSRLRVLHVISSMAAEAGGPPAVCAGLAEALAARGHTLTIATISNAIPGADPKNSVPLSSAVELASFPHDGNTRYLPSRGLDAWLQSHISNFDIVHLHSIWQFPTFAAARACWKVRKPYVVLLNGMLDQYVVNKKSYWLKKAYWLYREGRIEGRSKGIHFLNEAEIRRAVPWVRNMPKFIIGNGIRESEIAGLPPRGRFRAAHPDIADRPLALFLSRVHPKKGLDRLIPAWKSLAAARPDLRFAIAGTGDPAYVDSIDRLIASSGLTGKVLRVGQLVGEKKWEGLADADLFVLPSHQEGFSMAITEALAARCPVIATQECNFDELESQHCGTIIRNGDMNAFTQAVGALLDDPAKREAMGNAGAAFVQERCTWEKVSCDLEQVYRHILSGTPLPIDGRPIWRHH